MSLGCCRGLGGSSTISLSLVRACARAHTHTNAHWQFDQGDDSDEEGAKRKTRTDKKALSFSRFFFVLPRYVDYPNFREGWGGLGVVGG
jgi:hypothetical protein